MEWQTILSTLVGTLVGAVVGGFVTAFFARRSSTELRKEARQLRGMINALAHHLEKAGVIENVTWDQAGNLLDYNVVQLTGVPTDELVGNPKAWPSPPKDSQEPDQGSDPE